MSGLNPHSGDDPHGDQPVATAGADLADATAAVVCAHGRGATAQSMLQLTGQLGFDDVASLAPQAAGRTWYPNPFTAPRDSNQPGLDSALAKLDAVVGDAVDAVGREHVVVLGFSQGACLASEYVASNAARYGGLVVFSGGLIGPDVDVDQYATGGDDPLAATPAFLGCDANDPHIDRERVHETTEVLRALGAEVDERIYDGIGHGVVEDELDAAIAIVDAAREP
ncbi:alpha/beta hydrolase [Halorubellus salinus]|uniref:alpha/beta hydrolase n=1 Tax=Halorubellus salinus TaxID=755309 RepID=UPI001D069335|nr:dienelactone hydrolase family protein [Halorubellus salinus]